jgi:hypothetical protein
MMPSAVRVSVLLFASALAGCSGLVAGDNTSHPGDKPGVDNPLPAQPSAPATHRPAAKACPLPPLPPEPVIPDAGVGPSAKYECQVHTDCTAHPKGRCLFFATDPPYDPGGTRCVYDECEVDNDCSGEAVCQCGDVANECVTGNCRVDSDCDSHGVAGYCSPVVDPCQGQILEYRCRTSSDKCTFDSDCVNVSGLVQPKCGYDDNAGTWACLSSLCGA